MRRLLVGVVFVLLAVVVPSASVLPPDAPARPGLFEPSPVPSTRTVCTSGCTDTDLQDAINAASAGDTILLESGATFIEPDLAGFVMQVKSCPAADATCYVTIRTGVDGSGSVLSTGLFPAADIRVEAADASVFAKIQPNAANQPAIRSVEPGECGAPPCVASWYKWQWVEVVAQSHGGGSMVIAGSNNDVGGLWMGGSNVQNLKSEIPSHFVFDQLYIHGNAVKGQHRCMMLAARYITVSNSRIEDCKTLQNDGQAIAIGNTDGPVTITNNYISGSTENMISGGIKPEVHTLTTVSSATSSTVFSLTATTDLIVGQWIGVTMSSLVRPTRVTAIVGSQVTVSPALPSTPSVGAAVDWGIVNKDLTVRLNHFFKPLEWKEPVVGTPTGGAAAPTTGGVMSTGTYYLKIAALHDVNLNTQYESSAGSEFTCVLSGGNNACNVTWNAVTNVTATYDGHYRVYIGTSTNAQDQYYEVTAPTTGFTLTDLSGATAGEPLATGSKWSVKNIFELKGCDGALIEGNIFENIWPAQQAGYAITLTTLGEADFGDPEDDVSVVVRGVVFRKNKILNATGLMQASSADATNLPSGVSDTMEMSNNLAVDIGGTDAVSSMMIWIYGDSETGSTHLTRAPSGWTVDHNTILNTLNTRTLLLYFCNNGVSEKATDFRFTNNIVRAGTVATLQYASSCAGSIGGEGTTAWDAATDGSNRLNSKNIYSGASSGSFTGALASNYFPNEATLQAAFSNYAGGNYRITSTAYDNEGTDGLAIGADIDAIEALTDIALSGDNSGGTTTPAGGTRIRLRIRGN